MRLTFAIVASLVVFNPSLAAGQPTEPAPTTTKLATSDANPEASTNNRRSRNAPRILTEALVGTVGGVGIGAGVAAMAGHAYASSTTEVRRGVVFATVAGGLVAGHTLAAPPFVELAGSLFDEDGKLGMAYLGSGLGLLAGLGTGGLGFTVGYDLFGDNGSWVLGSTLFVAGPLVGSILGWELSRSDAGSNADTGPVSDQRSVRWRIVPRPGLGDRAPGVGLHLQF